MKTAQVTVSGRLDGKDIEKTYPSPGAGASAALTFAERARRARAKEETDEQTFYVRDKGSGVALFHVICAPDGTILTRQVTS